MAGSVNKVILVGNLGKDPHTGHNRQGEPICSFSIATSESWRDKTTGERKEKTEWHNVVIFNEALCKVAGDYLRKGMKVYVSGQLQTRKWQDKDGSDRYSTEVVVSRFKGELEILQPVGNDDRENRGGNDSRDTGSRSQGGSQGQPAAQGQGGRPAGRPDIDDDIPFFCEWR